MKRKLTLFLSAAVAMSSLPMTAYAANFKDINEVAWAATTINSVAAKGLLSGYEDGTFRGKNNVTYPEAMQMLYNAMVKSGRVYAIDAVTAYKYVPLLNTYKVPGWSQMAVAYGLENNVITMQDVATKFALGNKYATREDVADMFGKALAIFYNVDGKAASAAEFIDYYSIDSAKAPLVDLLKRLEIVSGDNTKRFNPKNNINRAEMAVMLNKTYGVLDEGVSMVATIIEAENKDGEYYTFKMEYEDGRTETFHAKPESVKVYDANNKEISLSRLAKGDEVRLEHNGGTLSAIYVEDGVSVQSKYDITGYITNYKDHVITVENENTGETDKYTIDNNCLCFIDGKKVKRSELEESLKENYKKHAYAGLITVTEREKVDQGGKKVWKDVLEVVEVHVEYTEELTTAGKIKSLSSRGVKYVPLGAGSEKEVLYADLCEFYIGDEEVDFDEAEELADAGTTYVKVTVDAKGNATKVLLSEDEFGDKATETAKEKTLEVKNFSDTKIKVEYGSDEVTYRFGSDNPLGNIDFNIWNKDEDDWEDMDIDEAVEWYDKQTKDVYAKIYFNNGDKITEIELSTQKSAWRNDGSYTERKGTIEDLEDGVLTFKGSSVKYQMLNKYNVKYKSDSDKDDDKLIGPNPNGEGDVKNPLLIEGAVTSSLTVFEKLAASDDVELYAEIVADENNKVVKIEATIKNVTGKLVEYRIDEDEIEVEVQKGKVSLVTTGSPDLTDEDEPTFTLEKIATPKYVGEKLELKCNSSGAVTEITVVDGRKDSNATKKVKGMAVAADDGLVLEGDDEVYAWMGRTSDITVRNYSGPSESLTVVKNMIEDPDVDVYVVAGLNDNDKVESISVYVRDAKGTLVEYDDSVVIRTEEGNKFAFDVNHSVVISIGDYDEEDLEDGKADGEEVILTFRDTGDVEEIKN